ncbi:hypothetical protein F0562_026447 [Nyssa sinensis]|uniref:Uncharacterized protein n=1 Tax=Nyssa sinensis TaxID=561372 RepID=A0A5J5B917_9ASTE|nr:hypothetical protein F0562_026447 [Nyssa sinensis]
MVKESVRKCSHCRHNGHNSRTCNEKGYCFKLFGVKIATEKEDESIRKSKSMGNLFIFHGENCTVDDAGYLSDGLIHTKKAKAAHERKKGVAWTEEEHRCFLLGLEKLGKGDWRGISRNFVSSRTPTQVASHAQKYFMRMAATKKKKLRPSLFDMPFNNNSPQPQPQSSQNSPVSPSHDAEISQQASTSAQVANPLETSQVLSMAANYGVPDFHPMPFMAGVPRSSQSFPAPKVFATVSFVPVTNFPSQGYLCVPRSHGNFATRGPFMSQSLSSLLPQQLQHGPSSRAAPGTSVTKKDDQALSIGVI